MVRSRKSASLHTAFTLVELVVSIGIFALMTTLVMTKYSNFNSGVLFTNAAYDVALAIRTAQTYGLSVKGDGDTFNAAYAIEFKTKLGTYQCADGESSDFRLIKIPFTATIGTVCSDIQVIKRYNFTQGVTVSKLCVGTSSNNCLAGVCTSSNPAVCAAGNSYSIVYSTAVIEFKRPDPDANIQFGPCLVACPNGSIYFLQQGSVPYLGIVLQTPRGDVREVSVYRNGQISVQN